MKIYADIDMYMPSKKNIKNALFKTSLPETGHKQLLITFDDGPTCDSTDETLSLLEEYNAKCIFFVVGRKIEKNSNIVKRIISCGHKIGNHSYYHIDDNKQTIYEYIKDIHKCQELIKNITGSYPVYYRPPMGTVSVKSFIIPKLLGLKNLLWSLDVSDWQCRDTISAISASHAIINRVKNNDIVLLHENNGQILNILKIILPLLHEYDLGNGLDNL